jgi:hypothetical protein
MLRKPTRRTRSRRKIPEGEIQAEGLHFGMGYGVVGRVKNYGKALYIMGGYNWKTSLWIWRAIGIEESECTITEGHETKHFTDHFSQTPQSVSSAGYPSILITNTSQTSRTLHILVGFISLPS